MASRLSFATSLFALAIAGAAVAAPIKTNVVAYSSLLGPAINFETAPAQNYDGILDLGPAQFAERFAGQHRTFSPNYFDILGSSASDPLSLAVGEPNDNVAAFNWNGSRTLLGLGWVGYGAAEAFGEGSIAVLFASDQSTFGFEFVGANGGSATLHFFGRSGTLIDSVVLSGLANGAVVFSRDTGFADIAGFSIFNDDEWGIAIDNLRFAAQLPPEAPADPEPSAVESIPEPSVLALLALAAAFLVRRRRAA